MVANGLTGFVSCNLGNKSRITAISGVRFAVVLNLFTGLETQRALLPLRSIADMLSVFVPHSKFVRAYIMHDDLGTVSSSAAAELKWLEHVRLSHTSEHAKGIALT